MVYVRTFRLVARYERCEGGKAFSVLDVVTPRLLIILHVYASVMEGGLSYLIFVVSDQTRGACHLLSLVKCSRKALYKASRALPRIRVFSPTPYLNVSRDEPLC